MELCRWLRWKGFHGLSWTDPEQLREVAERNEVPYSCLRTCAGFGPDDDLAALGSCGSHRTCFEASPVGPRSAPVS